MDNIRAIIPAAGQGKRLRAISGDLPKAMFCVNGKPMLEGNYDETIEKAAEWYRKAAVKGHKEAKKALERIKK